MDEKFSERISNLSTDKKLILADSCEMFVRNTRTICDKFVRDCSAANDDEINQSMIAFKESQETMVEEINEVIRFLRDE